MRKNPYYHGPMSDHFDGLRFHAPGAGRDKTFGDVARMLLRTVPKRLPWPRAAPIVRNPPPPARVEGPAIRLTFIGHSSFLLQTEGVNLLLDPVWSQRAGPAGIGPRRVTPPALEIAELPEIDAVLLSHNHYDHMDLATLSRLARERPAPVLTPLGNDTILHRGNRGIEARAFDWGQSVKVGPLTVHFAPALHWSARRRNDRRMALWASFIIEGPRHKVYFAGDTSFGDGRLFDEIGAAFGPFRLAILPIGAYAPRGFMKDQHCDPDEAVSMFQRLRADFAFACHWGTFRLTQEPYHEPLERLAAALDKAEIDPARFRSGPPGTAIEWA